MKLRVLNVNNTLDLVTGGGTAERTFQMSRQLALHNVDTQVLTIESTHLDQSRIAALEPAKLIILPCLWRRFNFPKFNWGQIKDLVANVDVIHLMGHWGLLNIIVYFAARHLNKPYVVCPAGALPLFGRSKWLKRAYNLMIGQAIVRNASGWIAVTKDELDHFESYGVSSQFITIIPNGVDEKNFPMTDVDLFRKERGLPNAPLILFMGRLNLIKGPDLLLQAFSLIKSFVKDYHLVFAGPDEGMKAGLIRFAELNGILDRVHFLGFVSGEEKAAAYRSATFLVVPSRQEAMSIVVLEAGICGKPVLLTDQCGFNEIKLIHPNLECTADVVGIAEGMKHLATTDGLLEQLGPIFRDFVSKKYTWDSIVEEYLKLYEKILTKKR